MSALARGNKRPMVFICVPTDTAECLFQRKRMQGFQRKGGVAGFRAMTSPERFVVAIDAVVGVVGGVVFAVSSLLTACGWCDIWRRVGGVASIDGADARTQTRARRQECLYFSKSETWRIGRDEFPVGTHVFFFLYSLACVRGVCGIGRCDGGRGGQQAARA